MKEFAQRRLEKAARTLEAAHRETAAANPDFAANHAYYAMFYAAEAALSERGLRFRSHGAVHGAFGKEFARTGAIAPEHHRRLLDAFEARQTAIYGVDREVTPEEAAELIDHAHEFVQTIRAYLDAQHPPTPKA